MDELFNFCKSVAAVGIGVFLGMSAWAWLTERERQRRYKIQLRWVEQSGRVEAVPVEEWPTELEARDK